MLRLWLAFAALHLCAAEFPIPYNSERDKSSPMPAIEAAAKLRLPPGFKATVFAAEPDVQNPIAMAWDARGRLWIAENYTYAESGRSEEHTSELQSQSNLVCRLLLEKKKNKHIIAVISEPLNEVH